MNDNNDASHDYENDGLDKYIDYFMLRAWYHFYSQVFNTKSQMGKSLSECAMWF